MICLMVLLKDIKKPKKDKVNEDNCYLFLEAHASLVLALSVTPSSVCLSSVCLSVCHTFPDLALRSIL